MTYAYDEGDAARSGSPLDRRLFIKTAGTAVAATIAGLEWTPHVRAKGLDQAALFIREFPTQGWASFSETSPLAPYSFSRRAVGERDVVVAIRYCGVCHSDIHSGLGHWSKEKRPLVLGHEIAGTVIAVGAQVSSFKVGDRVGVGSMVNSCGVCPECQEGNEQYCVKGPVGTHGAPSSDPGGYTQGGYSKIIVVKDQFVIRIPDALDLAHAGPIMCAGVTVFSPFLHWNVGQGTRVGIVGLGGLGHMAVKIASALGANPIVFTSSPDKVDDAKRFGAGDVIVNNNASDMQRYRRSLDFILDTVPYHHDLSSLMATLKHDATLCLVGIGKATEPNQLVPFATIADRNSFTGSLAGSIRETQEIVDFCAQNKISPEIEIISANEINGAWKNVVNKKARYRYVIDSETI